MPVFMQEEVQSLLGKMTGFDILRVARLRKVSLRKPRYQLLTDQELEEVGGQGVVVVELFFVVAFPADITVMVEWV